LHAEKNNEEDESPFTAMRKVAPKPHGMTGSTPMPNVPQLSMPPQPYPQMPFPQAYPIGSWNGMFGPYAQPIMMMPQLSTPMRKAFGIMTPTWPSTSKISASKGPKLKKWLQKVDEENNPQDPDASSSSSDVSIDVEYAASYYEAMKKEQLYYVADLLFLTPEQLRDAVGCSFVMAKRLLAKAESELSRNK
jgi:hypothetical protein